MKVWVVSTVDGSSPFRVEVEEGWIVDDLRSAIADKKKFSYGSDLLKIRLDRDSQDLEEDVVVSTILETGSSKKNPFYFVEHEDHGKESVLLFLVCLHVANCVTSSK